ncbi:MAG: hypothetical protein HOI47_22590 [Candidatus Scalindua sp.]|mgnify:CR=1 FL=1|jgi:hypothetical protein|nr:hypothetical protein [Candidatus Scalindua sp.]MBT6229443.1 hypothetical protein [Candidatus Scalindua sp.]
MSNNTIDDYSDILDKKAKSIAIDKLRSSGIDYKEMPEDEFLELVENRKDILVRDAKRSLVVGGAAAALTLLGGV